MKTCLLCLGLVALLEGAGWKSDLEDARRLESERQPGAAEKAGRIYAQLVAGAETLPPLESNALALELFYAGRYREAEPVYRASLAGWERLGAAGVRDRIVTAANLGTLLRAEGRFAEAESVLLDSLRRAETLDLASSGDNSLEWARAASGLGALYLAWQELGKAESFALRAQAVLEKRLEAGNPERVNNASILGSIYLEQGRYDEAEPLLRAALEHAGPRLATRTYNELAVMALRRYRLDEAESLALQALETSRQQSSAPGPLTATITDNLAQICLLQKRYVEAEQHYRDAISIWEATLGKQHPDTAKAYMNLAEFYHLRGRENGADELYRRAVGILEPLYGKDRPLVLVARNQLADVWRAEGRYSEAEKLGSASLAALEEKLSPQDPRVLRALANQARLLASTKRNKEAAALRERIQEMSRSLREAE
jgi:tetratricopeptide (TPR) repeat protein